MRKIIYEYGPLSVSYETKLPKIFKHVPFSVRPPIRNFPIKSESIWFENERKIEPRKTKMKPQNFQEYLGGIKFKNTEKKED